MPSRSALLAAVQVLAGAVQVVTTRISGALVSQYVKPEGTRVVPSRSSLLAGAVQGLAAGRCAVGSSCWQVHCRV